MLFVFTDTEARATRIRFPSKTDFSYSVSPKKSLARRQRYLCPHKRRNANALRVTRCPSLRGTVPHFQDFSSKCPTYWDPAPIVTGRQQCSNTHNTVLKVPLHCPIIGHFWRSGGARLNWVGQCELHKIQSAPIRSARGSLGERSGPARSTLNMFDIFPAPPDSHIIHKRPRQEKHKQLQ